MDLAFNARYTSTVATSPDTFTLRYSIYKDSTDSAPEDNSDSHCSLLFNIPFGSVKTKPSARILFNVPIWLWPNAVIHCRSRASTSCSSVIYPLLEWNLSGDAPYLFLPLSEYTVF